VANKKGISLEEYKTWLKENAYKEEEKAYEVAKLVVQFHRTKVYCEEQLFPRKKFEGIEFDLLIVLSDKNGNRWGKRVIGIEFKEYDMRKVIQQAIVRRLFVDYMYIASRPVIGLSYAEVFHMAYFGIGWIVWLDRPYLLLKAKMHYSIEIDRLLNQLISKYMGKASVEVAKVVEKKLRQMRLEEGGKN